MTTQTHDLIANTLFKLIAICFVLLLVMAIATGCETNAPAKEPTVIVTEPTPDPLPDAPDEWAIWWTEHQKTCPECSDPGLAMCMPAFEKLQEILKVKAPTPTLEEKPVLQPHEAAKPAEGNRAASQPGEATSRAQPLAGRAEHNPLCECVDCKCGDACACGTRYTAGGYSYRVKAGRVEVFVSQCVGGQCEGVWRDWYSLPNSRRAAIRGGERQGKASSVKSDCASCNSINGENRVAFFRRRGR
jgi:hypothetical protein